MNLAYLYMDIVCCYALHLDKDHNTLVLASLSCPFYLGNGLIWVDLLPCALIGGRMNSQTIILWPYTFMPYNPKFLHIYFAIGVHPINIIDINLLIDVLTRAASN